MKALLSLSSLFLFVAAMMAQAPTIEAPPPEVVILGKTSWFTPRTTSIAYKPGMTLFEALLADGYGMSDGHEWVRLIRAGKSQQIRLLTIEEGTAKDIPLQPWDILVLDLPR